MCFVGLAGMKEWGGICEALIIGVIHTVIKLQSSLYFGWLDTLVWFQKKKEDLETIARGL